MKKRMKTRDIAFQFRMGAGFAGDVNRMHPASIEPNLQDATNPADQYGIPVLVTNTGTVRKLLAADQAGGPYAVYGVSVRPYPSQQATVTGGQAYGATSIGDPIPPPAGVIDLLKRGYMLVKVPAGQAPVKGGTVYVWCAASGGGHILGGFEAAASGGNTAIVSNAKFNGGVDAAGVVEISIDAV